MRLSLALTVIAAVIGGGVVLWVRAGDEDPATAAPVVDPVESPAPGATGGAWESVPKDTAGVGDATSLTAAASDGRTAVLAGATLGDDFWDAALWWSEDGRTWHPAAHPSVSGEMWAVRVDGDVALALGSAASAETSVDRPLGRAFVWRSDDAGRTWAEVAMDPEVVSEPTADDAEATLRVQDLPGAHTAGATQQSALLRRDTEGVWRADDDFAEEYPGVFLASVTELGETAVLAGYDRRGAPGGWVSVGGGDWQEIPRPLRGPPGGMLAFATEVDDRVAVFGTAPELNRFYVFEP